MQVAERGMNEAEIQAAAADIAAENVRAVLRGNIGSMDGIAWDGPPLPGTLAYEVWESL